MMKKLLHPLTFIIFIVVFNPVFSITLEDIAPYTSVEEIVAAAHKKGQDRFGVGYDDACKSEIERAIVDGKLKGETVKYKTVDDWISIVKPRDEAQREDFSDLSKEEKANLEDLHDHVEETLGDLLGYNVRRRALVEVAFESGEITADMIKGYDVNEAETPLKKWIVNNLIKIQHVEPLLPPPLPPEIQVGTSSDELGTSVDEAENREARKYRHRKKEREASRRHAHKSKRSTRK